MSSEFRLSNTIPYCLNTALIRWQSSRKCLRWKRNWIA